jgi:hypothetical protein
MCRGKRGRPVRDATFSRCVTCSCASSTTYERILSSSPANLSSVHRRMTVDASRAHIVAPRRNAAATERAAHFRPGGLAGTHSALAHRAGSRATGQRRDADCPCYHGDWPPLVEVGRFPSVRTRSLPHASPGIRRRRRGRSDRRRRVYARRTHGVHETRSIRTFEARDGSPFASFVLGC